MRRRDQPLLTLKMDSTVCQGVWAASRRGTMKGNGKKKKKKREWIFPHPPEEHFSAEMVTTAQEDPFCTSNL